MAPKTKKCGRVSLSQILVDKIDEPLVKLFPWRTIPWKNKETPSSIVTATTLARLIMLPELLKAPDGSQVLRKNGNVFDNRRSNLEILTRSQLTQRRWRLKAEQKLEKGLRCQHRNCHNKAVTMKVMGKSCHYRYFCTNHAP